MLYRLLKLPRVCSSAKMCQALSYVINPVFNDDVRYLFKVFQESGHEIRVVGGSVRDVLMREAPKDIDLSTTATPDEMIDILGMNGIRYIETGLQHGTITAHMQNGDYQITTLRIDIETFGRAAKVEFTKDWRLDAERRDLTINAMSMDIHGKLYDYFNGENDLNNKQVRFVGDTGMRIREDYLRILRYFRFYGRIASAPYKHNQDILNEIKICAHGLRTISVERIWMEMRKILVGNFAPQLLSYIYGLGVAENINLPTYNEKYLEEFENVWNRTDRTLVEPVTLLTSLVENEQTAEELCKCWKLSNSEIKLSRFIAVHRYASEKYKDSKNNSLKYYKNLLVKSHNPKNKDISRNISQLLYYEGKIKEAEELESWDIPVFPITGHDLIKANVKKGPEFGKIMNYLKELWIKKDYQFAKEDLLREIHKYRDV